MHVALDDYHYFESGVISRQNPTMLEVGAFSGALAFAFLRSYPAGRVIVYEGERANFDSLQSDVEGDSRIVLHHAAIAPADDVVTMHRYTNRFSNSVFDRSCDDRELVEYQQVRGVTLETALRDNGVDQLDFLLLNCEGCELFALREIAFNAGLRDRVTQICVSFHCLHSKMYAAKERDVLLGMLATWFDVHIGNVTWEYFLLTKRLALRAGPAGVK